MFSCFIHEKILRAVKVYVQLVLVVLHMLNREDKPRQILSI